MKTNPAFPHAVALLTAALITLQPTVAPAQGTAFTYQGRLNEGPNPANGFFDITFSIWTSLSGPAQVGATLTNSAVAVSNGLFTVTLNFGGSVFTGQARWLEIGVQTNGGGGFASLTPRQPLLPAPHAIFAANASNVVAGSVVKSLNALTDAVTLTAGSNVTITPSGNGLTIASAGAGGSGIWSLNGNNTYYTAGNVGVGTATPVHRLSVAGGPSWTTAGWIGAVELANASAIAWRANAGGQRFGMGHSGGGFYLFRTAADPGTVGSASIYDFIVDDAGRVGIGTTAPASRLDVSGSQDALRLTGFQPFLTLYDTSFSNRRGRINSVDGGLSLLTESFLTGANSSSFLTLRDSGRVGIGVQSPANSKLEIAGQDALSAIGFQPFLTLYDNNAAFARARIQNVAGEMLIEPESFINGSNPNSYVRIFNSGNVSVRTVTIRGGADLAEPFEMSGGRIEEGSVVIIDPHNSGKLKLSHQAYDKRVAGIISGANGVNTGISLQQDNLLDSGQNVALTGRVYVKADASSAGIEPGDLLTSSDMPGHAMKAVDPVRTPGAVLGKAMTGLKDGVGFVLVLVTLQ